MKPYRITENLRLGADYAPREVATHFTFPEEDGSFARATTRCVGVGECRRHEGGTMCPSYMVTREEMHSTRGRARLLFEMLEGHPIGDGWRDETVLYDFGMLDLAKRMLRQILDTLRPQIRAGMSIVGLEPSCVAVFRDEMCNLFPHDQDALRLKEQVFTLAEFLERAGYEPPPLAGNALVHGHCHHKAVMKMTVDEKLLHKLGLEYEILDSGCCGMAGSFGFERDHYDVSIKVGERMLLPRVRAAGPDTLIIADGFSCREQIAQTTSRRALHLAEVLQLALRQGGRERSSDVNGHEAVPAASPWRTIVLAGVVALIGAGALGGAGAMLCSARHREARSRRRPAA